MRRAFLILSALLASVQPLRANELTLVLKPETTEVTFDLKATGENVHGQLFLQTGEIRFDPETGEASGEVRIDARRAETGSRKRDKTMHRKVLESEQHALIVFQPERVVGALAEEGASEVELVGTVVLVGQEHPLTLPATVQVGDGSATIESHFAVPYVEWGLHDPSFLFLKVAKSVDVTISGSVALSETAPMVAREGI